MSVAGRAGLWFLYGTGIVFLSLELLSLAGILWSRLAVLIATAVLFAGAAFLPQPPDAATRRSPLDLAIALYAAAYTSFAVAGPPWVWDFWALWGLKARTYFERGGIDFRFLAEPRNAFVHPDYPQLLPLNLAFPAVLGGAWDDRWLGFLFAAWALAAALVVRDLAARELQPHAASAAALATLALTGSRYVGLAETPLIAFATTGLLFTRRALLGDTWARVPAALLLGFAASTKNEGLTLLVAVALALVWMRLSVLSSRFSAMPGFRADHRRQPTTDNRHPPFTVPALAAVITAPWLIARAVHGLPVALAAPGMFERLGERLPQLGLYAATLLGRTDKPWLWALIAAALLFARRERFLVTVVLLQLAAFLAVYQTTPPDVVWHIETSWGRLSRQLLAPAAYAALAALAARFQQGSAHEARSES